MFTLGFDGNQITGNVVAHVIVMITMLFLLIFPCSHSGQEDHRFPSCVQARMRLSNVGAIVARNTFTLSNYGNLLR